MTRLEMVGIIVGIVVGVGGAFLGGESRAREAAKDQVEAAERRVEDYKNERDQEKEVSAALSEEVKTLEGDLRVLREACGPGQGNEGKPASAGAGSPLAEVSLTSGRSTPIPGTPLSLALTGVEFATGPNRHQAYFSVSLPGHQEKKVEKAEPGDSYTYEGYRIQVLRTDGAGARFSISREL